VTEKRPLVGIPVCPIPASFSSDPDFSGYTTYISDSYVKWVEASGGRVMPIFQTNNTEYIWLNKRINGLLVPSCADDATHDAWV